MIVEWVGGPEDGSQMQVKDGVTHLMLAFPTFKFEFYNQEEVDALLPIDSMPVPITRLDDGRFVIFYPKGKS